MVSVYDGIPPSKITDDERDSLIATIDSTEATTGFLESSIEAEDGIASHGVASHDIFDSVHSGEDGFESLVAAAAKKADAEEVDLGNTLVPPPETGVRAEIIVVITSLGSSRKSFFGSRRAVHLLDCKGVAYYVVDVNKDVTSDSTLKDQSYINEWTQEGYLTEDPTTKQIALPQILIDGVSVGDYSALQDMEEDYDLDWVIRRAACPTCFNERQPEDSQCDICEAQFRNLISEEDVEYQRIARYRRGELYYDDDESPTEHTEVEYTPT